MDKRRRNWGFVAAYWGVRAMQENGKKILRRVLLIQSLVFVLVLGGVTVSLAATTCGAPSACVVVIDNYYQVPYLGQVRINTFTGVDHSCSNIGLVPGEILSVEYFYWHILSKSYWNGTSWVQITGLIGFTPSAASDADYTNDMGSRYGQWLYPQALFPNGCSDLPSQKPDQTPNPDPGKPDCNNQAL